MNMNRALPALLVAVAALVFASPASAAHTVSRANSTAPTITVSLENDGGALKHDSCFGGFLGCGASYLDLYSSEGFTGSHPGCADTDGGANDRLRCSGTVPTRSVVNGSPANDFVEAACGVFTGGSDLEFNAGAGNDSVNSNCESVVSMGAGNDTAITRGLARGGEGDDSLSGTTVFFGSGPLELYGDAGRDKLVGQIANDKLDGGDDSDLLDGGGGADELRGGGGRDMLLPGPGTDAVIEGGAGADTVSYENVSSDQGLSISLNGAADDGASGENDNINTDVENVIGSASVDAVTGNDGVNVIETDAGNDNVDPGKGNDFVSTGSGDDVVNSRDGALDAVDCGDGNDRVVSDEFDNVTNCETNDKSRELMPDVDNDGVPAPADCDDRDPRRRPGLPDKPGNGLDEDCSGRDAPYFRIVTGVQSLFRAGATTKIMRLNLVDVPAGATVEVRCKRGKKTCLKRKKATLPRGAAELNIRKRFRLTRTKLRPGSILEVRITNTDSIGKVVQYPVRRRKIPISRLRCLPPGAKSPRRC